MYYIYYISLWPVVKFMVDTALVQWDQLKVMLFSAILNFPSELRPSLLHLLRVLVLKTPFAYWVFLELCWVHHDLIATQKKVLRFNVSHVLKECSLWEFLLSLSVSVIIVFFWCVIFRNHTYVFYYLCAHVCGCTHAAMHVLMSENNLW